MAFVQQNAETAVRNMLRDAAKKAGSNVLQAIDYLDDGSPITVKITVDEASGDAVFDFTGTGPEVRGNLNAPISVVHSAIIYWYVAAPTLPSVLTQDSMRAMVNQDIPLNAGCLVPLNSKPHLRDTANAQSSFPRRACSTPHPRLPSAQATS